jgi:triosephosphate isomerase
MSMHPPAATRPLVGAGLKMNLTSSEARRYFDALRPLVAGIAGCDIFVLPPFTALHAAQERLHGSNVAWGAQDVHPLDRGAHTGDISMPMLVDLGCSYVEVGHVERRRGHGETDEFIGAKVAQVLCYDATPILCIGEPAEGEPAAALEQVLGQLRVALAPVAAADRARVVIAYEPTWAIGVTATASPEHVAFVQAGIRAWLASPEGGGVAVRIIYGGSVDQTAAASLLAAGGIDGLFVGRAALDPARFADIAAAVGAARKER